jgi:hypothetical protein
MDLRCSEGWVQFPTTALRRRRKGEEFPHGGCRCRGARQGCGDPEALQHQTQGALMLVQSRRLIARLRELGADQQRCDAAATVNGRRGRTWHSDCALCAESASFGEPRVAAVPTTEGWMAAFVFRQHPLRQRPRPKPESHGRVRCGIAIPLAFGFPYLLLWIAK